MERTTTKGVEKSVVVPEICGVCRALALWNNNWIYKLLLLNFPYREYLKNASSALKAALSFNGLLSKYNLRLVRQNELLVLPSARGPRWKTLISNDVAIITTGVSSLIQPHNED